MAVDLEQYILNAKNSQLHTSYHWVALGIILIGVLS